MRIRKLVAIALVGTATAVGVVAQSTPAPALTGPLAVVTGRIVEPFDGTVELVGVRIVGRLVVGANEYQVSTDPTTIHGTILFDEFGSSKVQLSPFTLTGTALSGGHLSATCGAPPDGALSFDETFVYMVVRASCNGAVGSAPGGRIPLEFQAGDVLLGGLLYGDGTFVSPLGV